MLNYRTVVFPGTFDPFTNGHLALVQRAARLYERVYIGVATSQSRKSPLISHAERLVLIQSLFVDMQTVDVVSIDGLLVDWMQENSVGCCLKGLRHSGDFNDEFQQAAINQCLLPDMETVWLPARQQEQMIASCFVREILAVGGDISAFVPPAIAARLVTNNCDVTAG